MENTQNTKAKNYVVIAQGGHCGDGYFIPIVTWRRAVDEKQASEKTLELARVKKDKKHAIMYVEEISVMEGLLLEFINNYDPYLTASNMDAGLEERRLNIPSMVEIYNNIQNGHHKRHEKTPEIDHVKTAKSFSDDYPIQQHIAPYYNGSEYVYNKKIDMHSLLKDYFTVSVKNIAMAKLTRMTELGEKVKQTINSTHRVNGDETKEYNYMKRELEVHLLQFLMVYYKLFGANNPLNIEYDADRHAMTYKSDGKKISIDIPQYPFHGRASIGCMYNENFSYYRNRPGEEKNLEELIMSKSMTPIYSETSKIDDILSVDTTDVKHPSQTEKFYAKFKKHLEMKNTSMEK